MTNGSGPAGFHRVQRSPRPPGSGTITRWSREDKTLSRRLSVRKLEGEQQEKRTRKAPGPRGGLPMKIIFPSAKLRLTGVKQVITVYNPVAL
ncbi:uncharacterized protein CCOS01_05819 [Colletotrichum costaricense]|uniref:Uncharacterized protein n=1 Tax=Colletotrichum costaricense TaxID=1209916 RepID=A0AAI9Z172_9PEZI|nr:uncharacterized protein CCOS01_05819 [Colletotrichum costaricense]KAK1530716.1 hypothetical protein CCOS01_05819 [Colletotrichum costaricense]